MKQKAWVVFLPVLLAACSSPPPEIKPRTVSPFQTADKGPSMTYHEFREYSDIKAERLGGEELSLRIAERADGNRALHKRFLTLDRNYDGRLSHDELGGMVD